MPQFPRRNTQPMRADSYRRIARLLRGIADKIDAYAEQADPHHKTAMTRLLRTYADRIEAGAERADPRQRKSLTEAIHGAYKLLLDHWHRHHGRNPVVETREAQEARRALDRARRL